MLFVLKHDRCGGFSSIIYVFNIWNSLGLPFSQGGSRYFSFEVLGLWTYVMLNFVHACTISTSRGAYFEGLHEVANIL
jgi:hypothetical protein